MEGALSAGRGELDEDAGVEEGGKLGGDAPPVQDVFELRKGNNARYGTGRILVDRWFLTYNSNIHIIKYSLYYCTVCKY